MPLDTCVLGHWHFQIQQNLVSFELNRVLQTKETHILFRTQVAGVQKLCVRESQVSIKMKHYSANLVELILKIAVL